jgi:hypothetical protein
VSESRNERPRAAGARVHAHLRSNIVGYVALFLVLAGGTAYATHPGGVNTISTDDIIDQEVRTADIRQGAVHNEDIDGGAVNSIKVADQTLTTTDVADQTLTKADLGLNSVGSFELDGNAFRPEDIKAQYSGFSKAYGIPPNAIQSDEISDGTVTPADLAEEAKGPPAFQTGAFNTGIICNNGCTEGSLTLPPGFYAIFANIRLLQHDEDEELLRIECALAQSGTEFDVANFKVVGETGGLGVRPTFVTPSLHGVRLLLSRGVVELNCLDNDIGDVHGTDLQLTAIRVGSIASPG